MGFIEITGTFGPTGATAGSPAPFATHEANFGLGGYMQVADTTERDAITTSRRAQGMACWSVADNKLYILKTGVTNTDWVELTAGGGSALTIQDEGVDIDTDTSIINFTGTGVTASQTSAGEVEVNIPGATPSPYDWVVGDGSATRTLANGEQLNFSSGGAGLTVAIGPAVASPYGLRINNTGDFIISDDDTVPNTATISTGTTGQIVKFIGTGGISSEVDPVAKTVSFDGGNFLLNNLTHNKMWSGDASNNAIESDILEASNIADSNYVSIIGDPDTFLQIGDSSNPINLQTEIYSYSGSSLILGKDNGGAHFAASTVTIGVEAVEDTVSPGVAAFHNSFVVIGKGANKTINPGSYIRESVVIGNGAANGGQVNYASVTIGHAAGTKTGWRDVMIGYQTGSNVLQPASGFSNTVVGYTSYTAGDKGVVFGGQSYSAGQGTVLGYECFPLTTSLTNNVIVGTNTTAGSGSTSVGWQTQAITSSVSVGSAAGRYWDDNVQEDAFNVFVGNEAGEGDTGGDSKGQNNVAIGVQAFRRAGYNGGDPLLPAQEASRNICIGTGAGTYLRSNSNIAIGVYALQNYKATHWSNEANVCIGDEAGKSLDGTASSSSNNVMIGSEAGTNLTDGNQNVFVGGQAGIAAVANNNVLVGYRTQYGGGTLTGVLSDMVVIGHNAYNDHAATIKANSVTIGASSVGELKSTVVGATAEGYDSGIALGYNANQRDKGAAGNNSYSHLVSISPDTAKGFWDSTKGDANENGNAGNYCFFNNAQALAAGLKEGDIYVMAEEEGSNTPLDPYRLCIVLDITS